MERRGEVRATEGNLKVIMANLTDVDGLEKAFQGCRGVFHTSAFTDPAGLSVYTVSNYTFFLFLIQIFSELTKNSLRNLTYVLDIKLFINYVIS